jgi:hypothetical protein
MNDSLVSIVGDIVGKVDTELMPTLSTLTINSVNRGIENVNYMYGPFKEIVKRLTQWTASETYEPKKYPLVALVQPFNEVSGSQVGVAAIDDLTIFIAMLTDAESYTPTRYDINFYPVLYPIYYELLKQIDFDKRIMTQGKDLIQHTKVDWPYWDAGKEKNPFNDRLDVIEIKNMKLKALLKNC